MVKSLSLLTSLQVTDDYGNKCNFLGSPFINNCNYSTTYNMLQHIYGNITYASNSAMMNPANVSRGPHCILLCCAYQVI